MKLAFLLTIILAAAAAPGEQITCTPCEDADAVLHNPDMGWVLYENYPVDPRPNGSSTMLAMPGEKFDGVDEVAVMFTWADVETREDHYDFTKVDRAYDYWKKLGKRIQLRMSAESLLWWNRANPPAGKGVPDDLLQKLNAEKKQTRSLEKIDYVVVDARDELYRQRLARFLKAVAMYFNADRPVTLVDLRGFGLWGEWHSGFHYASIDDKNAALRGILDEWATAFPKHWLALSYSWDPDGSPELHAGPKDRYDAGFTQNYQDYLRFSAFDHAMTKPNITLRRDGVGGAVYSNERKFCQESFATLTRGPMSCEFVQGYSEAKPGGDPWLNALLDDALTLHPNYINVLGYCAGDALAFVREQPALLSRGAREMGYRLLPTRVQYPKSVRSAQEFAIEMQWINRGVGRAMRDFDLVFILADSDGKEVARCDAGKSGADRWIKGSVYEVTKNAHFENVPPGKYSLRFGLRDGERWIELPLKGGDAMNYAMGALTIDP